MIIKEGLKNFAKKVLSFKFDEICLSKFGSSKFSNIILLGVLAKLTQFAKENSFVKAIENQFRSKGEKIILANIEALKIGFSLC